jgi:acetyl-CoA carboxylase carboxyl transferase subunit beta
MPLPAGYRKAARLMRLAAKLGLPVITLIDTPGAYPGRQAEEQGQATAIAENLKLMAQLPVPVIAVITGEGGSGGALALGVANRVLMWQDAIYSVISPEGCAAILCRDPAAAGRAAAALKLRSRDLLELGVVDGVLLEPAGGVDADPAEAARRLRLAIRSCLAEFDGMSGAELRADRHRRFARYGAETVAVPAGTVVTARTAQLGSDLVPERKAS